MNDKIKTFIDSLNSKSGRKILIISGAVLLVLVAVLVIYMLIPKSYLKLAVAPQQVNISIDGNTSQSVRNTEIITLAPGHHAIKVSQTDFEDQTKDIDLTNGQTTEFIVTLAAKTDAANALLDNEESQTVIEQTTAEEYAAGTEKIIKDYPIFSILPIRARLYTIDSCNSEQYPDDPSKFALCVEFGQGDSDLAPNVLQDIQSRGYNPSDYEIIWNEYSNEVSTEI